MRTLLSLALLAASWLVLPAPARSDPSGASIEATHRALQALADDPAARSRLDARLAALIDGDAMARAAIGDAKVTDAQRRRVADALARLARVRVRAALLARRGGAGEPAQTRPGPGGTTRWILPVAGSASLDISIRRRGDGQLRAFDVITDSVGLVDNYRTQFRRLTEPRTMETVITTLEAKVAAAEAESNPPPAD